MLSLTLRFERYLFISRVNSLSLSVTEDNMYKISYPDPELYLDSGTIWTMELTMNYSDGEIDWTTTKELHVVFLS